MDRRAAKSAYLIRIAGREVEYRFVRRRRRTLGLTVDADGLKISAPMRAPWRDIEGFVREKESWILPSSTSGRSCPGRCACAARAASACRCSVRSVELQVAPGPARRDGATLGVPGMNSLLAWLKSTALRALTPRAAHFAALLGQPAPRVALSNARTQWGVCTESGSIRLSWRLVHIEPALADYVVAHEARTWSRSTIPDVSGTLVERLYPGWQEARERLELAGAALPIS